MCVSSTGFGDPEGRVSSALQGRKSGTAATSERAIPVTSEEIESSSATAWKVTVSSFPGFS